MRRRSTVVLVGFAVALACASAAMAHQTATNNGVTVTVHVTPEDEPVVGEVSEILVSKVRTRTGRFSWATCRCTMVVSNSAQDVLRKGRVTPRTEFTFPEAGAYKITVAGRVKRPAGWRAFKVSFAIRAFERSLERKLP